MKHGRYETYVGTERVKGCNCKPCAAAFRERNHARRMLQHKNNAKPGPKPTGRTHGLPATYNAGCRCQECRKTMASRRAAQRLSERVSA